MTIKFRPNYGYAPASPFWIVMSEGVLQISPRFTNPEAAENHAAALAGEAIGSTFHVLAVVSTITAEARLRGERFDPAKRPAVELPASYEQPASAEPDDVPVCDDGGPL